MSDIGRSVSGDQISKRLVFRYHSRLSEPIFFITTVTFAIFESVENLSGRGGLGQVLKK